MSLAELREFAKTHKISGISKLNKADLLATLKKEALKFSKKISKKKNTAGIKKSFSKKSKSRGKKTDVGKKPKGRKLKFNSDETLIKMNPEQSENFSDQKEPIKIFHTLQVEEDLAAKFIVGDPHIHDETYTEEPGEFPLRYGDHKLFAFPRDPEWVFIYWDLQEEPVQRGLDQLNCGIEEVRWVLRVLPQEKDDRTALSFYDENIHPDAQSWYLQLAPPGKSFYLELGLIGPEGSFFSLIRSNLFTLPANSPSEIIDKEWMLSPEQHQQHFSQWSFAKGRPVLNESLSDPKTGYGLSSHQSSSFSVKK